MIVSRSTQDSFKVYTVKFKTTKIQQALYYFKMPKRRNSNAMVGPVKKKAANNNVKNRFFATARKTEHDDFIMSCRSNSLGEGDKTAFEKMKKSEFKGELLV